MGRGIHLQRLYSMFPNSWPGKGLLLLRFAAGTVLIHDGIVGFSGNSLHGGVVIHTLELASGLLILLGFFTPIAGALVLVIQLALIFYGSDHLGAAVVLAALGCALAMLGPGAISIDARLFGRKRIEI